MRFVLDRNLFAVQSQEEALGLLNLFTTAAHDLQFQILLTDPPYLPGGENGATDDWLSRRDPGEANAFRHLLTSSLLLHAAKPVGAGVSDTSKPRRWHLKGPLSVRVERRQDSEWANLRLSLADAIDLLREPVHLILENERTDLSFLALLANPTTGDLLRKLVDQPGRIQVHGGGGGEAKRWIETLTQNPPTPAVWRKLLRAWVLLDKDAGEQDALALSTPATALLELCEQVVSTHGEWLTWICLLRREIESYVPDDGLRAEAAKEHDDFVKQIIAWRADPMKTDWAWSLDFKKGLLGDLKALLPKDLRDRLKDQAGKTPLEAHMLKAPFETLAPGELGALKRGMGNRLSDAINAKPVRAWAAGLAAEYDRGPSNQAPRLDFVQSLFDRI